MLFYYSTIPLIAVTSTSAVLTGAFLALCLSTAFPIRPPIKVPAAIIAPIIADL